MDLQLQTSIGEKIRSLRMERGLTQSALTGNIITRNMLSLIENGNAMPSLPTLVSLAEILQVPVGYFFAGDPKEAAQYTKIGTMGELHRAFSAGEYAACLSKCEKLSAADDEIRLLSLYCHFFIAKDALQNATLVTATTHLEEALRMADQCVYTPTGFQSTVSYLLTLLHTVVQEKISKDLLSPETVRDTWISPEFLLYVRALDALYENDTNTAAALYSSGIITSPVYLDFLRAKTALCQGDTATARPLFEKVLHAPTTGFFTARHALTALESCAGAIGDYKTAYKCASEKVRLFEKFAK